MNNSELNILNQSYIKTKNINSQLYTVDTYIGSQNQLFRLSISTDDDITTIASTNCNFCNVSNKYHNILSNNSINLSNINNGVTEQIINNSYESIFIDTCSIPTESTQNGTVIKNNITVDNFTFKLAESNDSWFINSELIDGTLSLSYSNATKIPSNNLVMELYKEGKISSPSFSIFITSANINRLYL